MRSRVPRPSSAPSATRRRLHACAPLAVTATLLAGTLALDPGRAAAQQEPSCAQTIEEDVQSILRLRNPDAPDSDAGMQLRFALAVVLNDFSLFTRSDAVRAGLPSSLSRITPQALRQLRDESAVDETICEIVSFMRGYYAGRAADAALARALEAQRTGREAAPTPQAASPQVPAPRPAQPEPAQPEPAPEPPARRIAARTRSSDPEPVREPTPSPEPPRRAPDRPEPEPEPEPERIAAGRAEPRSPSRVFVGGSTDGRSPEEVLRARPGPTPPAPVSAGVETSRSNVPRRFGRTPSSVSADAEPPERASGVATPAPPPAPRASVRPPPRPVPDPTPPRSARASTPTPDRLREDPMPDAPAQAAGLGAAARSSAPPATSTDTGSSGRRAVRRDLELQRARETFTPIRTALSAPQYLTRQRMRLDPTPRTDLEVSQMRQRTLAAREQLLDLLSELAQSPPSWQAVRDMLGPDGCARVDEQIALLFDGGPGSEGLTRALTLWNGRAVGEGR